MLVVTRVLKPNKQHLAQAAHSLIKGDLVAFPTETVYGLGANALSAEAVQKIFAAKGRPTDNPLIVHVSDISMVDVVASSISEQALILMKQFWPGPLTIVLPKRINLSQVVTAGLDTVAVRMPAHPVALELIKQARLPIAAPSANISGRPSPTKAQHVLKDLAGKVEIILDGGTCSVGLESTVLDCTTMPPVILRPGGITKEQLQLIVPEVKKAPDSASGEQQPRSPGVKYTHYSPRAQVILLRGDNPQGLSALLKSEVRHQSKTHKIAVLGTNEVVADTVADLVKSAGTWTDLGPLAEQIFAFFRQADEQNIDYIYVHQVPLIGIGEAIMNRLEKAATCIKEEN